jgi:hypothetical protein
MAGSTMFALAYNALLPHRDRLTTRPHSRRPLLDGEPLAHAKLVELSLLVHSRLASVHDLRDPLSIDAISRAATAHAFASPAGDPWLNALRGWLADAIAQPLPTGASHTELPPGWQDGPVARLTIHTIPHWFVSTRDIKAELNAYGPEAMRRIRATMKSLGWRERKCFAWGGRMWGFVRACEGSHCE